MNEKKAQTIRTAAYYWELGLLRFLYEKGVISEKEYMGIQKIAEKQMSPSLSMS